jgi:hypothetical protein
LRRSRIRWSGVTGLLLALRATDDLLCSGVIACHHGSRRHLGGPAGRRSTGRSGRRAQLFGAFAQALGSRLEVRITQVGVIVGEHPPQLLGHGAGLRDQLVGRLSEDLLGRFTGGRG